MGNTKNNLNQEVITAATLGISPPPLPSQEIFTVALEKINSALDGAPFKIITAHDGAEKSAHDG